MAIWLSLLVFLLIGIGIFGCIKSLDVFNSPDGERYRRMRAQGPFAPLTKEDVANDENQRKKTDDSPVE